MTTKTTEKTAFLSLDRLLSIIHGVTASGIIDGFCVYFSNHEDHEEGTKITEKILQ